MVAFGCKNCSHDLTSQVDFTIRALENDFLNQEGDPPEDVIAEGICPSCAHRYKYNGPMFTHYVTTRINESMWGEDDKNLLTEALEINEEQTKVIDTLIEEKRYTELDEYIRELLDEIPDDE